MRKIKKIVKGTKVVDGAGVHMTRVLSKENVVDFDPFLMLDSFDSNDYNDYIKGFPYHPHRGIETITYLVKGKINHKDSLGNEGSIEDGQSQWMSAGSGILHEEMPQMSESMLGIQIWLNLPSDKKMIKPAYFDITKDMIGVQKTNYGEIKVISGEYDGIVGVNPPNIKAQIYDISIESKNEIEINTIKDHNVFIFLIKGNAIVDGEVIAEKSAILFGEGDKIKISSSDNKLQIMFFSAKPLHEPIAWGGPIVMNTKEELMLAFKELDGGEFIK